MWWWRVGGWGRIYPLTLNFPSFYTCDVLMILYSWPICLVYFVKKMSDSLFRLCDLCWNSNFIFRTETYTLETQNSSTLHRYPPIWSWNTCLTFEQMLKEYWDGCKNWWTVCKTFGALIYLYCFILLVMKKSWQYKVTVTQLDSNWEWGRHNPLIFRRFISELQHFYHKIVAFMK